MWPHKVHVDSNAYLRRQRRHEACSNKYKWRQFSVSASALFLTKNLFPLFSCVFLQFIKKIKVQHTHALKQNGKSGTSWRVEAWIIHWLFVRVPNTPTWVKSHHKRIDFLHFTLTRNPFQCKCLSMACLKGSVAVANAKSFSATERNESFSFHSRGEFSSDFCFSVFEGNCVAAFACSLWTEWRMFGLSQL